MAQGSDGNWYAYFGDSTKVAASLHLTTLLWCRCRFALGQMTQHLNLQTFTLTQQAIVISNPPEVFQQHCFKSEFHL